MGGHQGSPRHGGRKHLEQAVAAHSCVFAGSLTGNIWDQEPSKHNCSAPSELTSLLCNYFHATQARGG